jgi:hypothetical protein
MNCAPVKLIMGRGIRSVLWVGLSLLCACSLTTLSTDGGGSRGGNPVVLGTIIGEGGAAARSVRVSLIAHEYNPITDDPVPISSIDTTDTLGSFRITAPDSGYFNIEAVALSGGARLLIKDISAQKDSIRVVPAGTLSRPGAVTVAIPAESDPASGYIYVPGTTIAASLSGASETVTLGSVPAGVLPVMVYAQRNSAIRKVIRYEVPVLSGDTTLVKNPRWSHCRRIGLNTTAQGASVATDVHRFPVLIRLRKDNFSFNQAQPGGRDLRFTTLSAIELPYEIERWDSVAMTAEVWVLVDTVHGNDDSQSIFMYWGNPDAAAASSGAAVFDTASGHAGVWHSDTTCADATAHHRNGSYVNTVATAGIIGSAQRFDGNGFIKIPGLLGTPASITLSAWAQITAVETTGGEVISVGDAALIRMDDAWNNKGTHGAYFVNPSGGLDSTHCFARTGLFYKMTGWHHLAYSVDPVEGIQSLYIDGSIISVTWNTAPILYKGIGADTYIGKHGNGRTDFDFTGTVDEVRVDKTVRTADWVKLCFMNQRSDDRLVVFK